MDKTILIFVLTIFSMSSRFTLCDITVFDPNLSYGSDVEVQHELAHCKAKGAVCGDKCLFFGTCYCGQSEGFWYKANFYCCIPANSTCEVQSDGSFTGADVYCPDGQKLPQNTFCEDQNQCPVRVYSGTAILSNCSHTENQNCPVGKKVSKVCNSVDILNYCYAGKPCPKAKKGLDIDQCYNTDTMSTETITCLSRKDPDKDLFANVEKQRKKRWNYYLWIDIKNGTLICQNETYPINELCEEQSGSQPCTLPNSNDIVELNPNVRSYINLCVDYGFWERSSMRCATNENNLVYKTHAVFCNRDTIDCPRTSWKNCQNSSSQKECDTYDNGYYCQLSKTCIRRDQICDGIIHCIFGEDEDFDLCEDIFPEEATITCIENRPLNYQIKIKAIPCNGIRECLDGSDENCGDLKFSLALVILVFVAITNAIYHYMKWKMIPKWIASINLNGKDNISDEWDSISCVDLIGDDLARLKNETTQTRCAELLDTPGIFSKIKDKINKKVFGERSSNASEPLAIVFTQLDPLKDSFLVARLIGSLGGILIVLANPTLFSSTVVFLLSITIFGPQLLGTLRILITKPWRSANDFGSNILLIIFAPFRMYIEYLKQAYLDLKLKKIPKDQELIQMKETLKRSLNMHVKLELGLETIYQLSGQLILLLLAYTQTPTQNGLKAVFHEGSESLDIFWLIISILLSFKTCITSHWKALTTCRERFPFSSRLMASLFCLFSCITRIMAIIMFFTGPLGLFNLLRHLQGEQYPWNDKILDLVTPNGTMFLGNNLPFMWNLVDRWYKNGSLYMDPLPDGYRMLNPNYLVSPPDYTLYTGIGLGYYLLIFMFHIAVHMIAVFIVKYMLSEEFRKCFNLLEKAIHCLENTNIPYNSREWDDGKGNAEEHIKRQKSNWIEILAVIFINFAFNALLLTSFWYLVIQMSNRHDVLEKTIGYLDMEQKAKEDANQYFTVAFIILLSGLVVQILLFYLYNGPLHPFANILKTGQKEEKCGLRSLRNVHQKIQNIVNGCLMFNETPRKQNPKDDKSTLYEETEPYSKLEDMKSVHKKMANVRDACLFLSDNPNNQPQSIEKSNAVTIKNFKYENVLKDYLALPKDKKKKKVILASILLLLILIVIAIIILFSLAPWNSYDTFGIQNSTNAFCRDDQYSCQSGDECIPETFLCDGMFRDCSDGSDEDNCFQCRNGTVTFYTRNVLAMSRKCNGFEDCSDGSDEDECDEESCVGTICGKKCVCEGCKCDD